MIIKKINFLIKRNYKKKINKNWKNILNKANLNSDYDKNIKDKIIFLSDHSINSKWNQTNPNLFDFLEEKEVKRKYKLKQIFLTKKDFLLRKHHILWNFIYKKLIKQFVITKKLDFLNIKTFFIHLFHNLLYNRNFVILFKMNMNMNLKKLQLILKKIK